jgi:proteasome alpha subunit
VAEVGIDGAPNALYHVVFDGTVYDRKGFLAMGGEADDLNAELERQYREDMALDESIRLALKALRRASPAGSVSSRLEVAVLERSRPRRSFRRLTDDEVTRALEEAGATTGGEASGGSSASPPSGDTPAANGPSAAGPAEGEPAGGGASGPGATGG